MIFLAIVVELRSLDNRIAEVIHTSWQKLSDPSAKSSIIWILGELGHVSVISLFKNILYFLVQIYYRAMHHSVAFISLLLSIELYWNPNYRALLRMFK